MSQGTKVTSHGIGICGLVCAALIVLKLVGVRGMDAISWFWIISIPFLPIAIFLGFVLIAFVVMFIHELATRR